MSGGASGVGDASDGRKDQTMNPIPKINVHRYPEHPTRAPDPEDFVGIVEPEDRQWIVYYLRNGEVRFAGKRRPLTGAIVEDDAPIRHFILWRYTDVTGVSGTGLVAHGYERRDGKATVHWLGTWPTETTHQRGVPSVEWLHGHAGHTEIIYSDGENQIVLPSIALPVAATETLYLTISPDDNGWVLGVGEPCTKWPWVKCGDPGSWPVKSVVADADHLVHGDIIVGVVINGEHRKFWHDEVRRNRMLPWRDVVELLAARPEAVIVTRLTPECGGDPAYHLVRIPRPGAEDVHLKAESGPCEAKAIEASHDADEARRIASSFWSAIAEGKVLVLAGMEDPSHANTLDPILGKSPLARLAFEAVELVRPFLPEDATPEDIAGRLVFDVDAGNRDDITCAVTFGEAGLADAVIGSVTVPRMSFHWCSLNGCFFAEWVGWQGRPAVAHPDLGVSPRSRRFDGSRPEHLLVAKALAAHFEASGFTAAAARVRSQVSTSAPG
jgi:hypothetical protein